MRWRSSCTATPPACRRRIRLVLRFNTSRSSLIVDPEHRAAVERELRHRRAVQSDRPRHQQVGHDAARPSPACPMTSPARCSASPAPAPSATPRIAPPMRSRKTSRPGWRRSSTPAPDPVGRAPRKRHRRFSRPARCRPSDHPALRPGCRPGARARRCADRLRRRRSQRSVFAGAARRRRTVGRTVAAGRRGDDDPDVRRPPRDPRARRLPQLCQRRRHAGRFAAEGLPDRDRGRRHRGRSRRCARPASAPRPRSRSPAIPTPSAILPG